MLKDLLESIPWAELDGAYGKVDDAPYYLMDLIQGTEDEVEEAINEFLFSTAFHQYTTYSCTAYVVKCVLFIIENENINQDLLCELYLFIEVCTHGAKHDSFLKGEILKGKSFYFQRKNLAGKNASSSIISLMEFCNKYG